MKELISPGAQALMVSDIEELFLDQRVPCTTSAPPLASLWSNGRRLKLKMRGIAEWLGGIASASGRATLRRGDRASGWADAASTKSDTLKDASSLVRLSAIQTRLAEGFQIPCSRCISLLLVFA